jgi:arginase
MDVQIIQVPYHLGRRQLGMGHGPVHLIERGLGRELADAAQEINIETISLSDPFANEIQATFGLAASIAGAVERAVKSHRFPLILAGNCASCLGTLAGLSAGNSLGVIWFDAHGDFNTPATTTSGFFDGMALAVATGLGWESMRRSIPGFEPIDKGHVAICGVRALDPLEKELLNETRVSVAPAERLREGGMDTLVPILDRLRVEVRRVYLHLDLDVLDPDEGRANRYAVPGGLRTQFVSDIIIEIGSRFAIAAAGITAYDPSCDEDDRVLRSAFVLARAIIQAAAGNEF